MTFGMVGDYLGFRHFSKRCRYVMCRGTNFTGGFKLYGRRGHPSELAVVDLKVALTKVDTGYDRDDLEDYSGSGDLQLLANDFDEAKPESLTILLCG